MLPLQQLTPRAKQEASVATSSPQSPACAISVNGPQLNPSSPSRRLGAGGLACCRRLSPTEGVLVVLLLLCGLALLASPPPSSPGLGRVDIPTSHHQHSWTSRWASAAKVKSAESSSDDKVFRQLLAAVGGSFAEELHNKGRTLQRAQDALVAHEEWLAAHPTHRRTHNIPSIIHQVYGMFHDSELPIEVPTSIRSFRQLNPDHTYLLWGPAELDVFVQQYWPAMWSVYRRLRLPVLKADLVRYMLVHTFGGVYSDVDTRCLQPIHAWADGHENVSMIVGIEVDAYGIEDWAKHWGRQLQISQWTFAAAPGHPILSHVLHRSLALLTSRSLDDITEEDVTSVTGPSAFTDAVFDYMATKGIDWHTLQGQNQEAQIADLYVLSITGFSPGVGHMGAESAASPRAKVQHMFKGAWTTHREQDEKRQHHKQPVHVQPSVSVNQQN